MAGVAAAVAASDVRKDIVNGMKNAQCCFTKNQNQLFREVMAKLKDLDLQPQFLGEAQVIMITGCRDSGRYLLGQCLKYLLKQVMEGCQQDAQSVSMIDSRRAEKCGGRTRDEVYESMAIKAM